VRKRPELINLLQLSTHFPQVVMRRLLVGLYDDTVLTLPYLLDSSGRHKATAAQ
jgi:hypothetical protein